MSTNHTPALLARFPETTYSRLLVWYPANSLGEVSLRYEVAAERLKESFKGKPIDDQMFWPWLFMQRHVAELNIKYAILHAARVRRAAGHEAPNLEYNAMKKHLRNNKLGHKLKPLAEELNLHLTALDLEPIDDQTADLLRDLADMDPGGDAFRYTEGRNSVHPSNGYRVDFPALAEAVEGMNNLLAMKLDDIGEASDYYAEMDSLGD